MKCPNCGIDPSEVTQGRCACSTLLFPAMNTFSLIAPAPPCAECADLRAKLAATEKACHDMSRVGTKATEGRIAKIADLEKRLADAEKRAALAEVEACNNAQRSGNGHPTACGKCDSCLVLKSP